MILLLLILVIISSNLNCAMGRNDGLLMQNKDISPAVATIGQTVEVSVNIRNNGKNNTVCNIKAYVGGLVVEERKEVVIPPQATIPMLFTFNTSSLTQGKYPIEAIVEEPSSQQTIFDLGTVTVEPEEEFLHGSATYAYSDLFYLLAVLPVGAGVSFFLWKRRRNRKKEAEFPEDLLPNLLNGVLKSVQTTETGTTQNPPSSDKSKYVC